MSRGFNTAGTGLIAQSKKLDNMANNIANARTTGFKKDNVITTSFGQRLASRQENGSREAIGDITFGISVEQVYTDITQGVLDQTGNTFDLAIAGEGFFTVRTTGGQDTYTRSGEFFVDNEGYLASDAGRVQGLNGSIQVGSGSFEVLQDGKVQVEGKVADTLNIYVPLDAQTMVKQDNSTFLDSAGNGQAFSGQVWQGYVEASNVDMTKEMMDIMCCQRAYQSNSQILKMMDASLQKANEVGKLR